MAVTSLDGQMTIVNIDAAAGNRRSIDPRIYGVAWAPDTATVTDLGVTLNRWGGNAVSRHNWLISTTNRAKDYFFLNIPDGIGARPPAGGSSDNFIEMTRDGGAQPVMTIPMIPLLPFDRTKRCSFSEALYGLQDARAPSPPEPPGCGNGKQGGVRMRGVNNPADTAVAYPLSHQSDWIDHMIATWGSAVTGGMRYYSLDNEPSLWSFDHWDVHPNGASYDEVWGRMRDFGAAIRAKDPGAIITGVEEWGWSGYFASGLDQENYGTPDENADRLAHGNVAYIDWLLQQASAYEIANGIRILDVLAVHFYPQNGEFGDNVSPTMQGFRNRSTRALWDPLYVDESWIGGTGIDGGRVKLIPRLKEWVANHYPLTEIGITEYNWGAEGHINGGTAQADILGIFGREGLDVAVRWTSPIAGTHVYSAFKMYRNYDGANSRFGDVSVSASGPNPDDVAAFASVRTTDSALTIMLVSKTAGAKPTTVNLANFVPAPGATAQRWQLDSGNVITRVLPDLALAGSSISLTLPAQSITLVVVPGATVAGPGPQNVSATPLSTSSVRVTWDAFAGAASYDVFRSSNNEEFALANSRTAASFDDTGLKANTTYIYKVRALTAAGTSAFSGVDAATTVVFTDDPLAAGTLVKASHMTQLRTAVNAMRASKAMAPLPFTDPGLAFGTTIKAAHVMELRTALDAARAAIGLPPLVYTDSPLNAGTVTRTAHMTELRHGVK